MSARRAVPTAENGRPYAAARDAWRATWRQPAPAVGFTRRRRFWLYAAAYWAACGAAGGALYGWLS